MKPLSREDFLEVVRHTPLISIDLVVRDEADRVLVGLRLNRPAKSSWFVPGGRIYKDERLDAAFERVTMTELGRAFPRTSARSLGVYEHLYDDNALEVPGVSTHYVVLGYEFRVDATTITLPEAQHSRFRWMSLDELMNDPSVHANTRAYFRE